MTTENDGGVISMDLGWLKITRHALRRMIKRDVWPWEVEAAARKVMPLAQRDPRRKFRVEVGSVALVVRGDTVITVMRVDPKRHQRKLNYLLTGRKRRRR